jgi:hypothetical protein
VAESLSIEVLGYDELRDGSEEIFERIPETAGTRFENIADQVASSARGGVPRESGALAASIGVERDGDDVLAVMGGEDVPYAGWIEFGGVREGRGGGQAERDYISEGRYLYPAALDAEPVLIAAGTKAAEDEIRRQRWPTPK